MSSDVCVFQPQSEAALGISKTCRLGGNGGTSDASKSENAMAFIVGALEESHGGVQDSSGEDV